MPQDLRAYLAQLERDKPETMLRVKKPLKAADEITALRRKLDAMKKFPVIIVERPVLDDGTESAFPARTFGAPARSAASFFALPFLPRRVRQKGLDDDLGAMKTVGTHPALGIVYQERTTRNTRKQ
ncbi:hypothetical protein [Desulfoferula mesophila]|uniref:Uncharacterized protein n=1 Tax=Desulfoferula mesophila TaxID=3058419 RepID=A0AAU9EFN4_9BACT|nr:hypothetical protein FAK_26660 [Desulfoferula mesophilus]